MDEDDKDNATDQDDDMCNSTEILLNSSPKIQQLLQFLSEHLKTPEKADKMKALIFVQRRHTAKIIYHVIKRYAAATNLPVRPDFMVGNNNPIPESIEAILQNKFNRDVIRRFERNETNLIVASSVLEEGVDLQVCNMVINLDGPQSFRSYLQTKGRARLPESEYVIFVNDIKRNDINRKLQEWQKTDAKLKEVSQECTLKS